MHHHELFQHDGSVFQLLFPVFNIDVLAVEQDALVATCMHMAIQMFTIGSQVGVPPKQRVQVFCGFRLFQDTQNLFSIWNPSAAFYPLLKILHHKVLHPVVRILSHYIKVNVD